MKITKKLLQNSKACPGGYKWFAKVYPDGVVVTKKNVREVVHKLFDKRIKWVELSGGNSRAYSICGNLNWLIAELSGSNFTPMFMGASWSNKTEEEIVDEFWRLYKELK